MTYRHFEILFSAHRPRTWTRYVFKMVAVNSCWIMGKNQMEREIKFGRKSKMEDIGQLIRL